MLSERGKEQANSQLSSLAYCTDKSAEEKKQNERVRKKDSVNFKRICDILKLIID
jgi:hypothetical protein